MEERNNNKDQTKKMDVPKIAGISYLVVIILAGMGHANLGWFWDIPSFQFVVFGTLAAIFASNKFEHIKKLPKILRGKCIPENEYEFQAYIRITELGSRYAMATGCTGTIIGIILMLTNMTDLEAVGPNMAVALITSLYGIMLSELVFMPIKGHIISIYSNRIHSKDTSEVLGHDEPTNKIQSEKETKFGAILLAVSLPIIALLILLFTMSDFPNFNKRKSTWQEINISEIVLDNFEVSYNNSKDSLFSLFPQSTELIGIMGNIYYPKKYKKANKHFNPKIAIEPQTKLNSNQSKLEFTIKYENRERDSSRYFNRFSYHVTLDTVNHILVEDGDYRIEFDIIPKSIEKPTSTPSVSSTLSPIDEE